MNKYMMNETAQTKPQHRSLSGEPYSQAHPSYVYRGAEKYSEKTTQYKQSKKTKQTKKNSSRFIAATLLFCFGLMVSVYPFLAQYINSLSDSKVVAAYNASVMNGGADTSSGAEGALVFGQEELDEDVYGIISIPNLSLELPIYVGDTDANLSKGIAHLKGSSLPVGGKSTHCVLAGHNGAITNEWFTHIDQLNNGDLFYIRNGSIVLTYEVVGKKVIEPTDTSDLYIQKDRDLATLLTCVDSGAKRLLVMGERIN